MLYAETARSPAPKSSRRKNLRVISGKYKGRKLFSPRGDEIRPTSDRAKEAVFDILQWEIEGARVLDLFAGSGSLGIEAASRGAAEVIFSDISGESISLINQNLTKIGIKAQVFKRDYRHMLEMSGGRFDIIFIDPPYGSAAGKDAMNIILEKGLLNEGGVIVFETARTKEADLIFRTDIATDKRDYGAASVLFIRKKNA
ncbi:MAG TPA: 16S rRNA (guanine(966)-N(2))-methyltransferase RsmD [Eubacteriales bacterium]|nr:16S rRNA (guanine(966)-N(2))-methyltransferase RsmD [Clostridia bacterium]HRR89826.1 16S rRNA (guanine(966)-N(2))-methyltransferase RsmD [Eubacteriales bacterium]HRU84399.1 16S rRNA (guanine(966)-N(2))-methyltransferase RsmD [Eubacteriales bacterium]